MELFSNLKVDCKINDIDLKQESVKVRQELGYLSTNDGELASFIAFAVEFPENFVCLIDSYDTVSSGFKNYACVAIAMLRNGMKPKGVRLDSGNLTALAQYS